MKVVFMVYEGTIQTDALKLVAKKMQSSLAVEGELPEEGLTTFGDDGQDLIMTLAKQIVNEDGFQAGGSLENIFTKAREAEQESERYLVDDSWDIPAPDPEPDPEPEPELEPCTGADGSGTRTRKAKQLLLDGVHGQASGEDQAATEERTRGTIPLPVGCGAGNH